MNSMHETVSVQTVLPEDYKTSSQFKKELETLQKHGYGGVELNIAHPENHDLDRIVAFLREFDLRLTNFASGLTAKTFGLSLSHRDEVERQRAVRKVDEIMDLLDGSSVSIILGFFKGPKAEQPDVARLQFSRSIADLLPRAEKKEAPLIVEATNRYESSVANSLADAYECIKDYQSSYLKILPDTYHMNIEEADMLSAFEEFLPYYDTVHLSDNNRYFPGFGAIDFGEILQHLKRIGYEGRYAIEGQTKNSFLDDCSDTIEHLSPHVS